MVIRVYSFISATIDSIVSGNALLIWVASLFVALVILWLAVRSLQGRWGRARRRRRARRAQKAEVRASLILQKAGYRIIAEQVRIQWPLRVNGESVSFTLIADYVVSKWGQRWVAEVKTGERSLDLHHGPTRRQMLEYSVAYAARGVLLVDAERGRVRRVCFPRATVFTPLWGRMLAVVLAATVIGLLVGSQLSAVTAATDWTCC